jgi:hypothetical protein
MEIESFIQTSHPFLAGMPEADLRFLARHGARTHFPAGTVVFREGESADRFYLIQRLKRVQTRKPAQPATTTAKR